MPNPENNQPQSDDQSPGVSGHSLRERWHEIRASLVERVQTRGFDLHCLQLEARICLDGVRWPDGVLCPNLFCESNNVQAVGGHEPMPYLCLECHLPFSTTSFSILNSINIDSLELLAATYVTVAHCGLVRARALAEWLATDDQTAKLLLEVIEKGIAGVLPANDDGDAVAQTFRVLAFILRGERAGAGVVIAATGVGLDWRRVLRRLDPVLQSRSEPTLPGIGPRVSPHRLAEPARKKRKPRQPRPPEPKAPGMRPDQMMIPFFAAKVRLERETE